MRAITPYNVDQDHQDQYQSKARMRLTDILFRSCRGLLFKFWTLRFRATLWGELGATYTVHLKLIGKLVVDCAFLYTVQ